MTRCEFVNRRRTYGAPAAAASRSLESLMEGYQRSEEEVLTGLVEELSPRVRRFFLGPHVTRPHAEDMLQVFWMRVHQARHTYQAGRPLLPWIYAIARYTRADEFRRITRTQAHDEVDSDSLPDPKSQARAAEARSELRSLMTSLSPPQREVILLLKVRGLSLKEAARATESTVGATKQMAHRAYTKLRAVARESTQSLSRHAVAS